jgi:hypothetical protein
VSVRLASQLEEHWLGGRAKEPSLVISSHCGGLELRESLLWAIALGLWLLEYVGELAEHWQKFQTALRMQKAQQTPTANPIESPGQQVPIARELQRAIADSKGSC